MNRPPTEPIIDPEALDHCWSRFKATGKLDWVRPIIAVLDGPDGVRVRLQAWLDQAPAHGWDQPPYAGHRQLLLRCHFPVDCERRLIGGPLDLDLHVALLARGGELKFAELPFALSQENLLHLAMKSAAVWSLRSMSDQDAAVAALCHQESQRPGGAARMHLAAPQA